MSGWTQQGIHRLAERLGVLAHARPKAPPSAAEIERTVDELAEWAGGRARVTVVLPDATRPLPEGMVAGIIGAVSEHEVTLLIATGLHRPPNDDEWASVHQLIEARASGLRIVDSGGQSDSRLVGERDGAPIAFHESVVDTDGIVVVGTVELHQYAGYSGGIKAVAIGCAAPETIAYFHRPALLRSAKLGVGIIEGNPFRAQLDAAVAELPPIFEVQALAQPDWQLFSGPAPSGWRGAVGVARSFKPVPRAGVAVVAMLGAKACNLYQASRGVTQLALQAAPPLNVDARILLVTEAPQGLGDGPGERAFAMALGRGRDSLCDELYSVDDSVRSGGGTQRAYVVAHTSMRHMIAYVSLAESPELSEFGWRYLATDDAVDTFLNGAEYLRVPDPIHHLPCLALGA